MAAQSINYNLADGTLVVVDSNGLSLDLTSSIAPGANDPLTLVYTQPSGGNPPQPIIRVGLITSQFVITLPNGQTLTLDPRTGIALGRLGWTVPRA